MNNDWIDFEQNFNERGMNVMNVDKSVRRVGKNRRVESYVFDGTAHVKVGCRSMNAEV